jgi:hypothetical protein
MQLVSQLSYPLLKIADGFTGSFKVERSKKNGKSISIEK